VVGNVVTTKSGCDRLKSRSGRRARLRRRGALSALAAGVCPGRAERAADAASNTTNTLNVVIK
jgi:hypothetical protein